MKVVLFLMSMVVMLCVVGCDAEGDDNNPLPTLIELSTDEVQAATAELTALPTETRAFIPTNANEPTVTNTLQPTNTPVPTMTPSVTPTLNPTQIIEQAATAAALETPRISTLTPVPIGVDIQPPVYVIPVVAADVIITEGQFQEEVNLQVADNPQIQSAGIDFITGTVSGIQVRLIASGGQVFVTGDVTIRFELSGGLLAISVIDINVGSGDAPQSFVDIVQNDLFQLIVDSFDAILTRRLGEDHDLEQITFTDTTMEIMLLIPE